jgi:AcrR family transcriptional regulator
MLMRNTSVSVSEKRPYLVREDRRKVLLEGASDLVEHQGWAGLTMSALAEHTGVSRQLVYQHFPNLGNLMGATALHIFSNAVVEIKPAIDAYPDDAFQAIHATSVVMLDMPKGLCGALWQLISGVTLNVSEFEAIRADIRDMFVSLWAPRVQKHLSSELDQAKTLSWMLLMAFWGMRQLVVDGVSSRSKGLAHFDLLVKSVLSA